MDETKIFSLLWQAALKYRVYFIAASVALVAAFLYYCTRLETVWYWALINATTAGLLPAAIVSLLWEFFIKTESSAFVESKTKEAVKESVAEISPLLVSTSRQSLDETCRAVRLAPSLQELVVRRVYLDREEIHLHQEIQEAQHRAWILLTSFG